ncbi:MAG TPA: mannosyltransferase family protein [Actinomycetota bacterium]|nr:mannosyltransferase family protein [Actinomycetota bacterium]
MVVLTRVVFGAVAYAAAWLLASGAGGLDTGFLDLWSRWDALHFFAIAEHGYTGPGSGPDATAFFPAFPLTLRALSAAGLPPAAAGLLVSLVASVVALAALFALAERDLGAGAGRRAVAYLALFPTAVFLVAPYSEALFLAGAIPAFLLARRGRWTLMGVPAALATATRFAGVFLLLGLVAELFRQRPLTAARMRAAAAGFGIALLPLVAYGAFLAAATGDPLHFFTDQRQGWGRQLTNPLDALANTWNTWQGADYPSNWIFAWRIEVLAAAVGVGLVVWAAIKHEWGYAVYMGTTMAALLSSTWYFSIPRMLLSLFPVALLLAEATGRRAERHEAALVVLAPLATVGVVVFTQGAWFY